MIAEMKQIPQFMQMFNIKKGKTKKQIKVFYKLNEHFPEQIFSRNENNVIMQMKLQSLEISAAV